MKLDPSRQTYFALFFSASANLFVHGEEKSSSVLHCLFPTSAKSPQSPFFSVICNFSYYGSIVSASAYQAKKRYLVRISPSPDFFEKRKLLTRVLLKKNVHYRLIGL